MEQSESPPQLTCPYRSQSHVCKQHTTFSPTVCNLCLKGMAVDCIELQVGALMNLTAGIEELISELRIEYMREGMK